jgi:hypothetical protein
MSVDAASRRGELKSMKAQAILTVATLAAVVLIMVGCTTVTTEVRTGPEENWRYTIKEPKRETSPNGPVGELSYRGREIRPYFPRIVVGNKTFDYAIRVDRSDFAGYRMSTGEQLPESAQEMLTEEERERGWYFAPLTGRRSRTPEDWVWVKRLNVEAFIAPRHISRLADTLDLYPVDGNSGNEPRSGVSLGIRFTTVF